MAMDLASFLAGPPDAPKGGLERVLGTLDRPGNIVRAVGMGKGKLALKNLLNLAEEAPSLGLLQASDLPGPLGDWFAKNLETTRREDKSLDLGFVGNIVTDPLTYLTAGGAGVAKGVAAAGLKEGSKKLAIAALRSGLTKAGKQAVEKQAAIEFANLLPAAEKLTARAKSIANPVTGKPLEVSEMSLKRVAENRALEKMLQIKGPSGEVVEKVTPSLAGKLTYQLAPEVAPELVEQGGLKFLGKTVPGTAGVDVLKYHPAAMAIKALGKIPLPGKAGTVSEVLGKTFVRGHGLGPREKQLLQETDARKGARAHDLDVFFNNELAPQARAFGPNADEAMLDIFAAKQDFDPRVFLKAGTFGGKKLPKEIHITDEMAAAGKAGAAAARQRIASNPALKKLSDQFSALQDEAQVAEQALGVDQGTITEYLKRQYVADSPALLAKAKEGFKVTGPGAASFTKGRKFEDITDAIKAGFIPEVNPLKALYSRLRGSIELTENVKLARRQAISGNMKLAETGKAVAQGKLAEVLNRGIMPERGALGAIVHEYNKVFKPLATTGYGPALNPSFTARNIVSGLFMGAMDPDIGVRVLKQFTPHVFKMARHWDNPSALKGLPNVGRYTAQEAGQLIHDFNVGRNTFGATELLISDPVKAATRSPGLNQFLNFSQNVNQGAETLMRVNGFLALLSKGIDPAEAARRVNKVFVDYSLVSKGQRTLRDVIPFAQYSVGITPTLLETLARRPRFATPVRELYKAAQGDEEKPAILPPWMRSQPTIPFGTNKAGQPQYITSLGTMFEQLNSLNQGTPQSTLERTILGGLTPAIKAPLQYGTNRDFFFGTPMDYNRTPKALQALGLAPTMDPRWVAAFRSLPIARQLSTIDKIMDDRKDFLGRVIDFSTGVKVQAVDERKELERAIKAYLQEKVKSGDVGVVERFYTRQPDQELQAVIKDYYKRLNARKKAALASA